MFGSICWLKLCGEFAGSGVDLYTVSKLLGHVNAASTARYAHLANDTLMAAAEAGAAKLNVNW